jgi:hypothetical protein
MNNPSRTTYRFTVPPTAEQGSYSGNCSASYGETYRQNALADYNSARWHDGLPPLSRMPKGTRYKRVTFSGFTVSDPRFPGVVGVGSAP